MRALFLIAASLLSRRIVTRILYGTVQPQARRLTQSSLKLMARVFVVSLVGTALLSAGIIVAALDLARQWSEVGGLYFSPMLWTSLALVAVGLALVGVTTLTDWLSPWGRQKEVHQEDNPLLTIFEQVLASVSDHFAHPKGSDESRHRSSPPPPRPSQSEMVH